MQPALIALTVFSIVLFLITKPLGLWLTPLAKGLCRKRRGFQYGGSGVSLPHSPLSGVASL